MSRRRLFTLGFGGALSAAAGAMALPAPANAATSGLLFYPVMRERVYDSRSSGTGPMTAGQERFVQAGSQVAQHAIGIRANLTVVAVSKSGFLGTHIDGEGWDGKSVINWSSVGEVVANEIYIPVSNAPQAGSTETAFNIVCPNGSAHVIVDVVGYFQ